MKFSVRDFFSKCEKICRKMLIRSHLLDKFLTENFSFLFSASGLEVAIITIFDALERNNLDAGLLRVESHQESESYSLEINL